MSARVFAIATFLIVLMALVFLAIPEKLQMDRFRNGVEEDLAIVKGGVTSLRAEIDTLKARVDRVEEAVFAK